MKHKLFTLLFFFLLAGCSKEKFFGGPDYYQDGFEAYSALDDLFLPDDELWSFTQMTRDGNVITVDSANAHTGANALKFVAVKSEEGLLSKCSISKHNMAFWEGETIRVTGWFYIQGTDSLDWLFLFDMEEQTAIGAGPGMRIALVNNQLRIEYKFYERDIVQPVGSEVNFPRDQWVEVVWEVKLSQKKKGTVKLWQDGQLLIDTQNNRTLPDDVLYSLQGTKGMYSSIEVGITANSYDNDLTLWVDDVLFERVE